MTGQSIEPHHSAAPVAPLNVTQAGQNNTNIAHIEHARMQMVVLSPQSSPEDPVWELPQMDLSCYHLFVIGGEDFPANHFYVDPSRALTEYTAEELKTRYQHLEASACEELLRFPALFMTENADIGRAAPDQRAWWGAVTSIRVQDNGIRIGYQKCFAISQQELNWNDHHFGIARHGRISEMNRTHWALKRVNLLEAFDDADISYLPFARKTGGTER